MNRKSLVAVIEKHCKSHMQTFSAKGKTLRYLSIFNDFGGNGSYGISENGIWCSIHTNIVREVSEIDHERVLFRLLDNPLSIVVSTIKSRLKALSLPESIILTFPFDAIITAALDTSWQEGAKKWINQGYPINDEMRLILAGGDKQNKIWLNAQKERLSSVLGL